MLLFLINASIHEYKTVCNILLHRFIKCVDKYVGLSYLAQMQHQLRGCIVA